jgi:GH24 family phage-related lysozyme (muramidase)
MIYRKMLEDLRKEVEQPTEAVLPSVGNGLVNKNKIVEQPAEQNDPMSNIKDWMSIIRANGELSRKKVSEDIAQAAEIASPPVAAARRAVEEPSKSPDQKRRSAFDNPEGGTEGGDFMLGFDGDGSLIRQAEGFRTNAYWDVNHWRTGYGSDTITKPDGTVFPVDKYTVVTKEDAERDLARRTSTIRSDISSKIGRAKWESLSGKAQEALTSVAYNYGELPSSVVFAARNGDASSIAAAVARLKSHNDGINAKRRLREAALIRGN